MSGLSGIMKGGWHPEKSGSGSSSGGGGGSSSGKSMTGLGIRNKTNAMIPGNKGKAEAEARANHVSAPLSSLKDASTFAPPPKRTGTGLAPAPPPSNTPRKVIAAPSTYQDPRSATPAAPPPKISSVQQLQEQEKAPPVKRGPYQANTTGLSTDNLPKPPARRDVPTLPGSPAPPSYEAATGAARPVPSLPPRLPARTNTGGSIASTNSNNNVPSNGGMLNQSAVNRLGASGISVPALGINRSSPTNTSSPSPPPPPRPGVGAAQVNALQNRFAKLGTSTTGDTSAGPPQTSGVNNTAPTEGTTWQQKQAALQTASAFQKDPSSVSLSDARSAATTANNFRQRHGEQVASGVRSANSLNQRYGVTDRVGGFAAKAQQQQQGGDQQQQAPPSAFAGGMTALAGKKKPPPPPPKKKPGLSMPQQTPPAVEGDVPPPIPISTRPQF